MIKKLCRLFLIMMLGLSACGTLEVRLERTASPVFTGVDSTPTSTGIITQEPVPPAPTDTGLTSSNANSEQYKVITSLNPSDGLLTDVYIQNITTKDATLFMTLPNVNSGNYHPGEYYNGNLYILRRMGHPDVDQNWSDELWCYDIRGNGKVLYSQKGLDFRVAPDESYAAVAYQTPDTYASMLAFVNKNAEVVQEFNFDPTGLYLDQPDKWSDDGRQFWGRLQIEVTPKTIYQITISDWSVKKFDVAPLKIGNELDLNANAGKIVYSDYPFFFTTNIQQQFIDNKTEVKLFLYDLNSQKLQLIATSITKPFSPKWLDNYTIQYDDPNGDNRIEYKIK